MNRPLPFSAFELREKIKAGGISAFEVAERTKATIEDLNPKLNAYTETFFDHAVRKGAEVDEKRRRGEKLGILAGIPVSVKDNITTSYGKTTCASRMLESYHAPYDATCVERLKAEDAIIIGKTNMDEFAMGSTTETSALGVTRNPWNPAHVPGGSSGGAACSVAAGMCCAALASDTGGSLRQPASFCGVTGLKPTYGRVSRYGLVAFGSSLDQIGPVTRDVRDSALLLQAISGCDRKDATSAPDKVPDYLSTIEQLPSTFKIAFPRTFAEKNCEAQVLHLIEDVLELYRSMGAEIAQVELPLWDYAVACYYIVAPAEASSNLARYDGMHYGFRAPEKTLAGEHSAGFISERTRQQGFGSEVKRRIMLGTYTLSSGYYEEYYLKALKVRRLIKEELDRVFRTFDLILTPVSPTAPFALGEKYEKPLRMYLSDIFTVTANLAGLPGLSLPCGFAGGLPVGFQLLSPPLCEERLFQAGFSYQKETRWHTYTPSGVKEP